MALLQILEPGQMSTGSRRIAIGIDLGTTNSLTASVLEDGTASCLADENGQFLLPSVVRYGQSVEVGYMALAHQKTDPTNTISSVKRLIGRTLDDLPRGHILPYRFAPNDRIIEIATRQGVKTPVEVSAEILKTLKARAEAQLGEVEGAVITTPAYFDDAQRQATKDAAQLAGLKVLRLINEPTAAAVAYGLDNRSEGVFAVYDLGGGTFDVSILRLEKGLFRVLSTGGDSALGGDDFDHRIYCHLLEEHHLSALNEVDSHALLAASRHIKELLTDHESAQCEVVLSNGQVLQVFLNQSEFFQITQPLVQKTIEPIRRALADAQVSKADINGVILVGGATRMKNIRQSVGVFFGQTPLTNLNPDQVVALGAAIQADVLIGNKKDADWLLQDVTPLSLGLETYGGLCEKIIPRNSPLPVARAQEFTTFRDGQNAMMIHVVQGERELVSDCRSLARFTLRGIPSMVAGAARIRVTFQVDADGLLSVTAQEETTHISSQVEVKPSYGLDDEQIAQMLKESFDCASDDLEARRLQEARLEGTSLVLAIQSALINDGDLLSTDEQTILTEKCHDLNIQIKSNDAQLIRLAIKALEQESEEFATRRMNRSIRNALTGQNIAQLAKSLPHADS